MYPQCHHSIPSVNAMDESKTDKVQCLIIWSDLVVRRNAFIPIAHFWCLIIIDGGNFQESLIIVIKSQFIEGRMFPHSLLIIIQISISYRRTDNFVMNYSKVPFCFVSNFYCWVIAVIGGGINLFYL